MWPALVTFVRIWSLALLSSLPLHGMLGSITTPSLQHPTSTYLWISRITYRIQPVPGTRNSTLVQRLRFIPTLAFILDSLRLPAAGALGHLSQYMCVASLIACQMKRRLSRAKIRSQPVGISEPSVMARYHDLHTQDLVHVLAQWATELAQSSPGAT